MPDYEYYCPACGHKFTAWRTMRGRRKRTACPKCEYMDCARVTSVPGVAFNGKGFYVTDNRGCDNDKS